MLSFDSLQEFGGWSETSREKFLSAQQIKKIQRVYVAEREASDGDTFLVMCFLTKTGKTKSHYLSKLSKLEAGEEVDPKSVVCLELDNGIDDPIYRLDGEPVE